MEAARVVAEKTGTPDGSVRHTFQREKKKEKEFKVWTDGHCLRGE
jgi:hypothetical protein